MLFGYTVAVVAGFLLTAVSNWTDIPTPGGEVLAGLVLLWLAGRIAPFVTGFLPHWVIAALDIAFLPVLAITLSIPLLRKRQTHNLVFLFVLAALTLANLLVHMQLLGVTQATANPGLNLAGMIRVFPPAISPGYYDTWLVLAAIFWSTAFAIFVISYAGILIGPRVDGRPG